MILSERKWSLQKVVFPSQSPKKQSKNSKQGLLTKVRHGKCRKIFLHSQQTTSIKNLRLLSLVYITVPSSKTKIEKQLHNILDTEQPQILKGPKKSFRDNRKYQKHSTKIYTRNVCRHVNGPQQKCMAINSLPLAYTTWYNGQIFVSWYLSIHRNLF